MRVEIKGRLTKEPSQEFSRIQIQFLAALSKLDKFLVHQHVPVQSGTVAGTSRNMNIEIQKPTEHRFQNDPCREPNDSAYLPLSQLIQTQRRQSTFHTLPRGFFQENKIRRVSQVSHNFAVKSLLRQLRQTEYYQPFNSLWVTTTQQLSTVALAEFLNRPSH